MCVEQAVWFSFKRMRIQLYKLKGPIQHQEYPEAGWEKALPSLSLLNSRPGSFPLRSKVRKDIGDEVSCGVVTRGFFCTRIQKHEIG